MSRYFSREQRDQDGTTLGLGTVLAVEDKLPS